MQVVNEGCVLRRNLQGEKQREEAKLECGFRGGLASVQPHGELWGVNGTGGEPPHQPVTAVGWAGCQSQAPPGWEAPIAQGVSH